MLLDPKYCWNQNFVGTQFCWTQDSNMFSDPIFFVTQKFWSQTFFGPKIYGAKQFFWIQFFSYLIFIWFQRFFGPKMHLRMEFDSGVGPTCLIILINYIYFVTTARVIDCFHMSFPNVHIFHAVTNPDLKAFSIQVLPSIETFHQRALNSPFKTIFISQLTSTHLLWVTTRCGSEGRIT